MRISDAQIRRLCEYHACDLRKLLHTLQCWGLAPPAPDATPAPLSLEHTLSLGNGHGRPTHAQVGVRVRVRVTVRVRIRVALVSKQVRQRGGKHMCDQKVSCM